MNQRCGIWLKNELRLRDNPLFAKALKTGLEVAPCYCLDPLQLLPGKNGMRRCGYFRARFLLDSLRSLECDLRKHSSGLLVFEESPLTAIPRFVAEWNISVLVCQEEFGTEEIHMLHELEAKLASMKCRLERLPHELLLPLDKLPFSLKNTPEVFTSYRQKTEALPIFDAAHTLPDVIPSPSIPPAVYPDLNRFFLDLPSEDERSVFPFPAGEEAAFARLRYYGQEQQFLSVYKETRNGLLGSDYSSKFSPWLANGTITAVQVWRSVKEYEEEFGANDSTYWLIFELRWRDFFRLMMLKYGSRMFSIRGYQGRFLPPESRNGDKFEAWCLGRTGNDFVDAGMRELLLTGFLGNRMRQVVASYLIDYLKIDWRLGAAWFEQQLIDYDVSSNWGNWSYIAGVGSDPRGKRVFNPVRQADMYDPDGTYRRLWLDKE